MRDNTGSTVGSEITEHERLAELHWIGYTMTARITEPTPMWNDLDPTQRASLVTAMELMLELGHLSVPGEDDHDGCLCPDDPCNEADPSPCTNCYEARHA